MTVSVDVGGFVACPGVLVIVVTGPAILAIVVRGPSVLVVVLGGPLLLVIPTFSWRGMVIIALIAVTTLLVFGPVPARSLLPFIRSVSSSALADLFLRLFTPRLRSSRFCLIYDGNVLFIGL